MLKRRRAFAPNSLFWIRPCHDIVYKVNFFVWFCMPQIQVPLPKSCLDPSLLSFGQIFRKLPEKTLLCKNYLF